MSRRKRLIAVGMNSDSSSYLIFSDDTPGRKRVYLDHLRRTGNRPDSLRKAGMTNSTLRHWRRTDEEFRIAEADAAYEAAGKYQRKIADAAMKGDWKAAHQMVKVLAPEEAGVDTRVQIDFTPPPRLARTNISEIPVKDPDIIGEFREVSDATAEDPTEEEGPRHGPVQPALPAIQAHSATQADRDSDDGNARLGPDSTRDHQLRDDPGHEPHGDA